MSTDRELQERLARARENHSKESKLREHLALGQLGKATQIADELGGPLPRGVVVSLSQARARQ